MNRCAPCKLYALYFLVLKRRLAFNFLHLRTKTYQILLHTTVLATIERTISRVIDELVIQRVYFKL